LVGREREHNIWKSPGGALFFKLGIPPNLRSRFLSSTGKPKVKITEPLGTYDPREARVLRDQKLAHYQRVFARMAAGVALSPEEIATERRRVHHDTLQTFLTMPPVQAITEEEIAFKALRAAIKARVLAEVAAEVRRIADEKYGAGVIAEGSKEWEEIRLVVTSAKTKSVENYLIGLIRGEPVVEQPAPATTETKSSPLANGEMANGNLERFSVALDHYIGWLRDEQKARVGTLSDYKSKAERFVKFANDPSLGAVTIDDAKAFLTEVAESTEASTVNLYHVVCKAVFEHARKERHRFSGVNPFSFKRRKYLAQSKAKFTAAELNRLFNSPTFTEREIKPKTYGIASALPWTAVITLYSGASLEEVCQLRREDLRIEHGNGWVIHITHEAALSGELKRKSRERTIPLHPELERLGLLKYHAALPRDTEWLFPGLPVHKSKNKRSPRVGRAFNNWRRQLGIDYEDRQLDFHSLRQTFDTAIEDVGISQSDRARLLGHPVPGISSSVYSASELKRVAPLVARVKWEALEELGPPKS